METNKEKKNNNMDKARKARKLQSEQKIKRTYGDRKWLFTKSCIEKLNLDKIANLCGVEYDVIWEALKKLDIPIIIMVGHEEWCDWVEKHEKKIAYRKI